MKYLIEVFKDIYEALRNDSKRRIEAEAMLIRKEKRDAMLAELKSFEWMEAHGFSFSDAVKTRRKAIEKIDIQC